MIYNIHPLSLGWLQKFPSGCSVIHPSSTWAGVRHYLNPLCTTFQPLIFVCASGGFLTAKGAIGQPLARLNQSLSDGGSKSKPLASKPRTFDGIQAWPNFVEEAMALFESLGDDNPRFERQVS